MKLKSKMKFGVLGLLLVTLFASLCGMFDTHAAHFAMTATAPVALSEADIAEFRTVIADVKGGWAEVKELPGKLKLLQTENETLVSDLKTLRKQHLGFKSSSAVRAGQISDECARHLGAIVILSGIRGGQISGSEKANAETLFKEIVGIEAKTAITSSDMPLPTQFSGEVVELVSMWGAARKYATVFPLGTGTVKLPKLGTDTTFGLIAGSATVTEKSPTYSFVTFTPEKFGGLVRLPSEIIEDSIVNIGQFLARYISRQLAYVEDYQVFRSSGAGSGINGTAEGLCKSVVTDSKTVALASTKTAFSDATLAKFRELRTKPDAAALRNGAYYLHPSFEQLLNTFNTAGDKPFNPNSQLGNVNGNPLANGATLDGFPIRWLDCMPVYSTSAAASTVFALFGDVSFQYLGIRGGIRFDTSMEAGFTTDEILVRGIERLTTGKMATGAVGGLITAAS